MKPEIAFINDFTPNQFQKFFIDTNVWIFLLFPEFSSVNETIIRQYSNLFNEIIKKQCLIETNIIQISETLNLIMQLEYKDYKNTSGEQPNFKKFRSSPAGKKSLGNAQMLINNITKHCSIRSGNLTESDLVWLSNNIEKADFNDLCYSMHCSKENAILITHDFDFNALNQKVNIISANKNYR